MLWFCFYILDLDFTHCDLSFGFMCHLWAGTFLKKKKFNGYKLTIIEKGIWTLVLLIININIYYWTRKLFFFLFFFTLFDCVGDIGLAWLCFYKLLELINCVNIFKYQLEKDRKYAGQELESFVNNLGIPFLKLHQE